MARSLNGRLVRTLERKRPFVVNCYPQASSRGEATLALQLPTRELAQFAARSQGGGLLASIGDLLLLRSSRVKDQVASSQAELSKSALSSRQKSALGSNAH